MNAPSTVALITGAGSGIGRALVQLFASNGWAIAAVDRLEDGLRPLADELELLISALFVPAGSGRNYPLDPSTGFKV
jgi:NADP-dependent 3-hydroxy acid dehydrogenase YdfG